MTDDDPDRRAAGFRDQTRLAEAREALRERVDPIERTERVPLSAADGRVLAAAVRSRRDVPHYRRAAMDGYAVRAADTFGASDRSPAVLREAEDPGPERAVRVHTGSAVPEGADAVVMIEDVDRVGDELEVFDAVAEGENVAPVGEDVDAGQALYDPGHRLRPSDLGLLKSVMVDEVEVYARPTVGVVPTGEELVQRDLVPEVVEDLGEVLVHGVGIKPGHPVALGVVEDTPVLCLPGYPVSCIVTAVQFLRPLLAWLVGRDVDQPPTRPATLARKIDSDVGTRTFARVELAYEDGRQVARPTRTGGAGVLSSVALADGWIEVEEDVEGLDEGELVAVQDWEWHP